MSFSAMRSAWVIARRELDDHAGDPLVWVLVSFAMVLAAFSTQVGLHELQTRHAVSASLSAQRDSDRQTRLGQVTGWQIEPGMRVIRSSSPLSSIVTGYDTTLPQFWDFGPAGIRSGPSYLATAEPPILDLEVIIRVALGLLAILLGAKSVAGERASGTLLALLGQPVRPAVVLAGKLIGAGGILASSLLLVIAVVFAATAGTQASVLTSSFVVSTISIGVVGWTYLFVNFTVGVLASSIFSSYRAALTAGAIVWLISGASGVAAAEIIARSLVPMPPRSVVEEQKDRIVQDRARAAQVAMGDEYLKALPAGADWRMLERDPAAEAVVRQAVERVWRAQLTATRAALSQLVAGESNARRRRSRVLHTVMLASLGAQLRAAATDFAGTGSAEDNRWENAVARYQSELDRYLFEDPPRLTVQVAAEPRTGPAAGGRYIVGLRRRAPPTNATLPPFSPPERSTAGRLADGATPAAILIIYLGLVLTAAVAAFKRIRF